ncbi:MAG: hypothetical protein R3223_02280 [Longimicrobiales bacterium]|nr:hypothetical protein [Longimicrobiales bacterium]
MAAGLVLLRQHKESEIQGTPRVFSGESVPATVVLERIRNAGI